MKRSALPLVRGAEPTEPGHGTGEEASRIFASQAGQQFGVGEPAGIIDGHVQVLPTDAHDAIPAVTGHPMAGPADAAQGLDIEVQHLAGTLTLVADRRRPLIELGKPPQAEAP